MLYTKNNILIGFNFEPKNIDNDALYVALVSVVLEIGYVIHFCTAWELPDFCDSINFREVFNGSILLPFEVRIIEVVVEDWLLDIVLEQGNLVRFIPYYIAVCFYDK